MNRKSTRAGVPSFPSSFKTQHIRTDGATTYVRIGGVGPSVVMLPGFGETGDMWAPVAALLVRDHTMVVPDLRGMGLSSHPEGGYDKKTQARDIAQLMDKQRVEKAAFVTHDIGNMVGYAFAAQFPSRVTRWIAIDAQLPGIGPWDEIIRSPALWHFNLPARPSACSSRSIPRSTRRWRGSRDSFCRARPSPAFYKGRLDHVNTERQNRELAAAKPFKSGTVSMSHTMTWGMSSVSVPQCDIPQCQFIPPVTRPEGYNGMSSEKFVPTEDIGRVSSPPSCCESALTRRVPNRLLVAGSKSRGRPRPSSRTEIKIACLSGCRCACTQIEPPGRSG